VTDTKPTVCVDNFHNCQTLEADNQIHFSSTFDGPDSVPRVKASQRFPFLPFCDTFFKNFDQLFTLIGIDNLSSA